MSKAICLLFLLFCIHLNSKANGLSAENTQLISILKLDGQKARDKQLIAYLKGYFGNIPIPQIPGAKAEVHQLLLAYNIEAAPAFDYFIENLHQQRILNFSEGENYLIKAVEEADKYQDHYLTYSLFSHLAFLQTYQGNTIEAVNSFRMAKKAALTANDPDLQVAVDINISDIYYKNNLFNQSLFYLNQAMVIAPQGPANDDRLKNIIYYNIAENYFRMNKLDSLKKYNALLNENGRGTYKIYVFRHRTDYYVSLLKRDYQVAINNIERLRHDSLYRFDDTDEQYLAEAYHRAGKPDSAKSVINRLLVNRAQNNHPEIKFHLYEMLGEIAAKAGNPTLASENFKMAFQQLELQNSRLTQVGNISSQMKIDEIQGSYIKKDENYKRQRLWFIFTIVVSLLTVFIGAMFYRNIKQKRYYENLLYNSKKQELAFINSHEVRRHLANILGVIGIIKNNDNRNDEEYRQAVDHLLTAAESLDSAIKNISQKLDD